MNKSRILIVDDSKTIRKVLLKQLASFKAELFEGEDGQEGLEKALEHMPHMIITDIDMPRMNGFELCRQLKSDERTRHIPVLMLSANENEEYIEKGFEVGATAYVPKINASRDLLPRVNDILEKSVMLRNSKVLVVDDSKYIRGIVSRGLMENGFGVELAENGMKALEILGNLKPDMIITDLNMPVMDGIELCENIRSRSELDDVPVLIMSSESDRRLMREMMQRGASGYILKPFNLDQLVIYAEKLLSDHFRLLLLDKQRLTHDRDMLVGSIASLIQALEARDPYTRGHSESVAAIASLIAKEMDFSESELHDITLCARLHDIGKIGIPDKVLLKPGRLTHEEFSEIQRHPLMGAQILKPIPSMSEIIPGVLQHHEKIDGSGYPYGLSGDAIHLWARIIAVADVYHAVTSSRPYRDPMGFDKALEIIGSATGNHLCSKCVSVFLKLIHDNPDIGQGHFESIS
ncbi:response regulator [Desulfonatronovibrio magnus]|uniref:response regulator n=1 Tax=Desulfonatronovibrio magnus TaxID=698827 RepID=UPI0005EBA206|nr:response regulator [Desulfonatronovibrio magnus]